MGKIKKAILVNPNHSNSLDQQILEETYAKSSTRIKKRKRQEDEEFVSEKLSKKILKQARLQQEDIENGGQKSKKEDMTVVRQLTSLEIQNDLDLEEELFSAAPDCTGECDLGEEDAEALAAFMSNDPMQKEVLADTIKEKLTEKHTEIESQFSDIGSMKGETYERFKRLYEGVGQVLSRYRSGKLPKAFKTLPMRVCWEQLLFITQPDNWTAAAMYQATRIFASNLNEKMAQRFYNLILLPRLRDDIAESKMLNFHLYQALKKSIFKPAAFFKGIILPLCKSGDCTLREATIIGSVLAKCSIPILHSSAAITTIADMGYNGANSIFLRVLLEKKYALPYRAIDAVVNHFLRFSMDKTELPLLWHQCLLTFTQNYKNDISTEQQDALLNLLTVHRHVHVTPEIRKELMSSTCKDAPNAAPSEEMKYTE